LLLHIGIEPNPGPATHHLKICHINVNSVVSPGKFEELCAFVESHKIEIILLSETKLDETVHPSLFELPNFHPPFLNNRNRHGGGTAVYVHSKLSASKIQTFDDKGEEWTWAKIKVNDTVIITCSLYLPPNQSADRLNDFIDNFTESYTIAQSLAPSCILIFGDFNTGNIFLDNTSITHSGITAFDRKLKDTLDTLELRQLITQPTRIANNLSNLRDLAITSDTAIISDSGTLSPFSTLDHFSRPTSVYHIC